MVNEHLHNYLVRYGRQAIADGHPNLLTTDGSLTGLLLHAMAAMIEARDHYVCPPLIFPDAPDGLEWVATDPSPAHAPQDGPDRDQDAR